MMNSIVFYLAQVILIQCLFALLYGLVYRKQTFYQLRRFYLLGSVLLSFVLPRLISLVQLPQEMLYTITLDPVMITASGSMPISQMINDQFNWMFVAYGLGMLAVAIPLSYAIVRIVNMIQESSLVRVSDTKFCIHPRFKMPASFMGYILMNQDHYDRRDQIESIIEHEREHIRQGHSWDLLFLGLAKIFFWISPAIWWITREIKYIHEYQADQKATQADPSNISHYCTELFNAVFDEKPQLIHSFSSPNIKNRIMQLKQKRTSPLFKWTYIMILPLLLVLGLFTQSCQESAVDGLSHDTKVESTPVAAAADEEIFKVVEQMPRFPGCEEKESEEMRKECAMQEMLKYIYTNVKYPKEARTKGLEGTVVVRFVVDKNGKVKDEVLLRDLGGGCGEESLRVVKSMRANNITWTPGYQSGKPVNVQYNLPIKFKLEG